MFHDWEIQSFKNLLMLLLRKLEPKRIVRNQMIQTIQEDVQEIVFLINGSFEVGYNHYYHVGRQFLFEEVEQAYSVYDAIADLQKYDIKKHHYPLKFKQGEQAVGSLEVFFKTKSQFLFRACSDSDAFFIREKSWHQI